MTIDSTFPTVDVLGFTTGRLLGEMAGIYKIAEFLAGHPVWTHQLPDACRRSQDAIRSLHPDLKFSEDAVDVTTDNYQRFRSEWLQELGPTVTLNPALAGCLSVGNPIDDLVAMRPDAEIIVIDASSPLSAPGGQDGR